MSVIRFPAFVSKNPVLNRINLDPLERKPRLQIIHRFLLNFHIFVKYHLHNPSKISAAIKTFLLLQLFLSLL
jgi:hypothetical protein